MELFMPGTEPKQQSTMVQLFPINIETGKLALPGTPPELVETRPMYVFPPQAQDWYASLSDEEKAKTPQAPTDFDTRFGGLITSGDVAISFPANNSYVSAVLSPASDPNAPVDPNNPQPFLPPGIVQIRGNARGGNWMSYRVSFAPGWSPAPEQWIQIGPDHPEQVSDGVLENWDITALPPGPYSLKVSRFESDGNVVESVAQVTIDNTPPKITLAQPRPGEFFSAEKDEWVTVTADVQDDYSIGKVEFFVNGELFATRSVAPFTIRWTIRAGGRVEFYAVAYDGAGNRTESARVSVSVGR
jgi:hypothetical protein